MKTKTLRDYYDDDSFLPSPSQHATPTPTLNIFHHSSVASEISFSEVATYGLILLFLLLSIITTPCLYKRYKRRERMAHLLKTVPVLRSQEQDLVEIEGKDAANTLTQCRVACTREEPKGGFHFLLDDLDDPVTGPAAESIDSVLKTELGPVFSALHRVLDRVSSQLDTLPTEGERFPGFLAAIENFCGASSDLLQGNAFKALDARRTEISDKVKGLMEGLMEGALDVGRAKVITATLQRLDYFTRPELAAYESFLRIGVAISSSPPPTLERVNNFLEEENAFLQHPIECVALNIIRESVLARLVTLKEVLESPSTASPDESNPGLGGEHPSPPSGGGATTQVIAYGGGAGVVGLLG